MIRIASIRARVHFGLFDILDAFIFQTLLDFEKLLSCCLILRVPDRADSIVPLGALRAQKVPVDGRLDLSDGGFRALMRRVRVLIPPVEARLVLRVVQLAVMD